MNDIPAEVLQMAQRGPAWAEWVKALAGERRDVLAHHLHDAAARLDPGQDRLVKEGAAQVGFPR